MFSKRVEGGAMHACTRGPIDADRNHLGSVEDGAPDTPRWPNAEKSATAKTESEYK